MTSPDDKRPSVAIEHPIWNGKPILIGDIIEYEDGYDEVLSDTLWEIRWHPDGECWMHPTTRRNRVLRVWELLSVNGEPKGS